MPNQSINYIRLERIFQYININSTPITVQWLTPIYKRITDSRLQSFAIIVRNLFNALILWVNDMTVTTKFKNKRITENIVRDSLRDLGFTEANGFTVEEQRPSSPILQKLLKPA